jgi:exopolysaccharide production protein ExoZ
VNTTIASSPKVAGRIMAPRYESLDWLRGLLACAIMQYHLHSWAASPLDASSVLGRLGVYGVSAFFTLSGLSIAIVYHDFFMRPVDQLRFFTRRIFRIWPLLWLCIFSIVALKASVSEPVAWKLVAANLTTAFAFFAPQAYINTGAWSIGNEMVYYALTPLFIAAYRRRCWLGNLVTFASVGMGLWFSQWRLDPTVSLTEQWVLYINPFNNLFFYCAGISIYFNLRTTSTSNIAAVCSLMVAATLLTLTPVQGDQIRAVTGAARVIFSLAAILAVFGFYRLAISWPERLLGVLSQLGAMTYGVYMLHPVIWQILNTWTPVKIAVSGPLWLASATAVLTLISAALTYRWIEQPLIKFGKAITPGRRTSPQ